MPAATPASYAWLRDGSSLLGDAGCLTVVPGQDRAKVAEAFGADLEAAKVDPDLTEQYGAFPLSGETVFAVEANGFQGTRAVVLTRASKASSNGKAASLYWNAEGVISFACAAKGKLVANLELGFADDLEELPRSLRRLAALADSEGADALAVAAAMVATYTGAHFTQADLNGPFEWHLLEPPLDLLPAVNAKTTSLAFTARMDSDPEVIAVIAAIKDATPLQQRRLAERVVAASLRYVDSNHPRYAPVVAQFGGEEPAVVPPSMISYLQKLERLGNKAGMELAVSDGRFFPYRSMYRLTQTLRIGIAVRYACHPDPATAAWESIYQVRMILGLVAQLGGTDVSADLYQAALAFLRATDMNQAAFNDLLTPPLDRGITESLLARERADFESSRASHRDMWGPGRDDYGPIAPFELPR